MTATAWGLSWGASWGLSWGPLSVNDGSTSQRVLRGLKGYDAYGETRYSIAGRVPGMTAAGANRGYIADNRQKLIADRPANTEVIT